MDNVAKIRWTGERYELTIGNVLKAYTNDDHEAGKEELIQMVKEKGYIIDIDEKGEN